MKKFLGIVVISFLWCNISFADDNHLNDFNQWLYQTSNHQYLNIELSEKCKSFDKGDTNWYYNNCDEFQGTNNLKIKFYKNRSNIPWNAKPNFDTLLYYLFSYIKRTDSGKYWLTEGSKNPYAFESDLREDKYVDKQLKKAL